MTLYQIYDLASYIAGKFNSAGAVPPSRANILFPQISDELYQSLLKEVIAASVQADVLDKVLSTTPLRPFKKTETIAVGSQGTVPLPADYNRYISLIQQSKTGTVAGTAVQSVKKIDILSETEFSARQGNIFTRADVQPFAKIDATKFTVVPYDLLAVQLEYFRPPAVPYMDVCQSTANPNRTIYMTVGSSVYLDDAGVPSLFTSTGVLIEAAVTKAGTYPVVSKSVEFEWESQYHHGLVYLFLSKVGINLGENEIAKFALQMAQG